MVAEGAELEDPAYRTAIDRAILEFRLNNWAEAAAFFQRAHELQPSARTLRGMGMAAYEGRHYVDALRNFRAALNDSRKRLTEQQRREVQQWIEQASAFTARLQVNVEPPHAALRLDGQSTPLNDDGSLTLDPGPHELSFSAPRYHATARHFVGHPGQQGEMAVRLQKVDRPAVSGETLRLLGWTALGGAVAFGVGASALWFTGQGRVDDVQQRCRVQGCSPAERDALFDEAGVRTFQTWTNVGVVLSGASLIGAGVLFMLDALSDGTDPGETAAVRLQVQPTGLRVSGGF